MTTTALTGLLLVLLLLSSFYSAFTFCRFIQPSFFVFWFLFDSLSMLFQLRGDTRRLLSCTLPTRSRLCVAAHPAIGSRFRPFLSIHFRTAIRPPHFAFDSTFHIALYLDPSSLTAIRPRPFASHC